MVHKIEKDRLRAELEGVESVLKSLPKNDFAGRVGLEHRAELLRSELTTKEGKKENLASVALYFGGQPVDGSRAIDAAFATEALSAYQELITKVWNESMSEAERATRRVPREASHLNITDLVHGSFGFMLEEIDYKGDPMFETALFNASKQVAEILSDVADTDEGTSNDILAIINNPILSSVRKFYGELHKAGATFRIVEGDTDRTFDARSVERAYERVEHVEISEKEYEVKGEMLGIIPIGRRFEFKRADNGEIIKGRVGLLFSHQYLERISKERLVGKPCKATFQKREINKFGKVREVYILVKLVGI